MDIDDEDILRQVAGSGAIDFSLWPALLPCVVSRVVKIAHEQFPIPRLPPPPTASAAPNEPDDETEGFLPPLPSSPFDSACSNASSKGDKENTPAAPRAPPPPTSAPPAPVSDPEDLPPQAAALLLDITTALTSGFPTYPPHTLQRLSELVLEPKNHYKSLPAYLHALSRVVRVTSGLNVYPLPPAIPETSGSTLLSNGVSDPTGPSLFAAPGSDEALGGALLTPIPWLPQGGGPGASPTPSPDATSLPDPRPGLAGPGPGPGHGTPAAAAANDAREGELRTESTETIDGPNGVGSIETVTVVNINGVPSMGARGVGVTQGELLRQEQRAGIVPMNQLGPTHHAFSHLQQHNNRLAASSSANGTGTGPAAQDNDDDDGDVDGDHENENDKEDTPDAPSDDAEDVLPSTEEDERPHARGPEEIGPADTGPQHETTSSANYGGPGADMQGIDVEAAVGRKASSPEGAKAEDGDKMEGVEDSAVDPVVAPVDIPVMDRPQSSTPKREADEDLEGPSKRLKEAEDEKGADAGKGGEGGEGEGADVNKEAEGKAPVEEEPESKAADKEGGDKGCDEVKDDKTGKEKPGE